MNDDLPIKELFRPFREAKAPQGFADRVMARVTAELAPGHSWLHFFGLHGAAGRWAWAGGLAVAASVAMMILPSQPSLSVAPPDLSIYLADSSPLEEETNLGNQIEDYFL